MISISKQPLYKLFFFLSKKRKNQLYFLFFLLIINGILESFTIASIIPFISIIAMKNEVLKVPFFAKLLNLIGISDLSQSLLLITILFCIFISLSTILRLFNLRYINYFSANLDIDISRLIFKNNIYQPYISYINKNSYDVITVINDKVSSTASALCSILNLLSSLILGIFIMISLFLINWRIVFLGSILLLFIYLSIYKRVKKRVSKNGQLLATLYPKIEKRIVCEGRSHWLKEEYIKSNDPATYTTNPEDAWRRLKIRNMRSRILLRLMHLSAWREIEAQQRDLPRNRILRDETLIDLAGSNPKSKEDFNIIRNFPGGKDGKFVTPILEVLHKVSKMPDTALPDQLSPSPNKKPPAATMDLLKVLLKYASDEHRIAPRLIASAEDLELLAHDTNTQIPALSGWRKEIFGNLALKLKNGKISLAIQNGRIRIIDTKGM